MPSESHLRALRRHGARRAAAVIAAACVVLLAPATAAAEPDTPIAITGTHALGLDGSLGCAEGGNVELSDDRGLSWGPPGPCVPWDSTSQPVVDTTNGHVTFADADEDGPGIVSVVDGNGNVLVRGNVPGVDDLAADAGTEFALGAD